MMQGGGVCFDRLRLDTVCVGVFEYGALKLFPPRCLLMERRTLSWSIQHDYAS